MVNGYARYLKNHSFYYLYRTTTGHWMITWFEVRKLVLSMNSRIESCLLLSKQQGSLRVLRCMLVVRQPDIDEDKGEYRSEGPIETPEQPTKWVGGTTGTEYPSMVVYVRGSVPFAPGRS